MVLLSVDAPNTDVQADKANTTKMNFLILMTQFFAEVEFHNKHKEMPDGPSASHSKWRNAE